MDFPWMLYELLTTGSVSKPDTPHIGQKTAVPVISDLSALEQFFDEAVHFDNLEKQWPDIQNHLKNFDFKNAAMALKDSLDNSVRIEDAFRSFQTALNINKDAQEISSEDDPFVGLGALFVLGSLIRYGKLPPEVTH